MANDEITRRYLLLAGNVTTLYVAILPDTSASDLAPRCAVLNVIAQKVRSTAAPADISGIMEDVDLQDLGF